MRYIYFTFMMAGLLCTMSCEDREAGEDSLTNVVILLSDDLGYGDLHSYGGASQTPHLDALAENGLKFTDFYAPAPNCSPARAGLLTCQNPNRLGIYTYRRPNHSMHLRDEAVTIAEMLKQNDYATAIRQVASGRSGASSGTQRATFTGRPGI